MSGGDGRPFIDALKDRASLLDAVAAAGFTVVRSGKYHTTAEHDSLSIDAKRGWYEWYSKAGQAGGRGDVITWMQHHGGQPDFLDAVRALCDMCGMPFDLSPAAAEKHSAQREMQTAMACVADYLQQRLVANEAAMRYCADRAWPAATVADARLGFWDGNRKELAAHMQRHGLGSDAPAAAAVMGAPAGLLIYTHWLHGRCVYLSARGIEGKTHYNMPRKFTGERQPYFNWLYARFAESVVVVEGQADAISLGYYGIAAVALAGSSASLELTRKLQHHKHVYIAMDADAAGDNATRSVADQLGPAARIVSWPAGMDANDWHQSGAAEKAVRQRIERSRIYASWVAERASTVGTGAARDAAIRDAYEIVARLDPFIMATHRGELANYLAAGSLGTFNAAIKAMQLQIKTAEAPAAAPEQKKISERAEQLDPITKAVLLREKPDHDGHASCVQALYPDAFCFVPQWGWLAYDGKRWVQTLAEQRLRLAVVDTLRTRQMLAAADGNRADLVKATFCSDRNVGGVARLLQDRWGRSTDQFDADPDVLNVNNGLLNLRTGEIEAHHPQHLQTYAVAVDFKPDANQAPWMAFMAQTLDGQPYDVLDFLQVAVGYSLTGHTREELLFYVYGPTRSGKGTFSETLLQLVGKPLGSTVDFTTLVAQRSEDTQNFDLAPLKPCRLVVAGESGKYQRLNAAKLKQLTGGDEIRCAFKRRDHFEFKPMFKIWLFSNWPLNLDVDDHAAWGRVGVVPFLNSNLGKEDKGLKARMLRPDVLQGVLAWAVAGSQKWYAMADRGLKPPAAVRDATQSMRDEQDMVKMWLDECAEWQPNSHAMFTATAGLYPHYQAWCKRNGIVAMKVRNFAHSLDRKGLSVKPQGKATNIERIDGQQVRVRYGLKMRIADGQQSAIAF